MAAGISNSGYRLVSLGNRSHCVHCLVAEAFIPNPENKNTVNHKDGDKLNNRPENLEWATYSENLFHKCRVLGLGSGESHYRTSFKEDDILDIRALRFSGAKIKDIAKSYGEKRETISAIVNHRSWKNIP